jgi:hypothetical protein
MESRENRLGKVEARLVEGTTRMGAEKVSLGSVEGSSICLDKQSSESGT